MIYFKTEKVNMTSIHHLLTLARVNPGLTNQILAVACAHD